MAHRFSLLLLLLGLALAAGRVAQQVTLAQSPAGTVVFDDEFSGTSLDSGAWFALTRGGDPSNNEVQCYSPANVSVSGGYLNILTQGGSSSSYSCPYTSNGSVTTVTDHYLSGMVQWRSFNFSYGRIDIRAKEGGGQGPWPSAWLLGYNCQTTNPTTADNVGNYNWPNAGSDEIDFA